MVLARPTCLCLPSVTLFSSSFVDGEMSATTIRPHTPDMIFELSATLGHLWCVPTGWRSPKGRAITGRVDKVSRRAGGHNP